MGITTYHRVNGILIGQTKDGVRTHFVSDAAGSVVATLDSNGSVENRYWYKPFGGLLAKTGTGEDPRFLWKGTLGFRTGPGNIVSPPPLAKPLYPPTGSYISKFLAPQSPYAYGSRARPCIPKMTTDLVSRLGICGQGAVTFNITFDNDCQPQLTKGWIIQKVTREASIFTCDGEHHSTLESLIQDRFNPLFEGWRVVGDQQGHSIVWFTRKQPVPQGSLYQPNATDTFSIDVPYLFRSSRGSITIRGRFGYYPGDPKWTSQLLSPWAEDLPTSLEDPTNGHLPFDLLSQPHSATFSWNCCTGNWADKITKIVPFPKKGESVYGGVTP